MVLGEEGTFRFSYRTRDIAGNWEAVREATYNIDLFDPMAEARTVAQPGLLTGDITVTRDALVSDDPHDVFRAVTEE